MIKALAIKELREVLGIAFLGLGTSESKARIGFIDKAGLRETTPGTQEGFPFDSRRTLNPSQTGMISRVHALSRGSYTPNQAIFIQAADDKLYHIDLKRRAVKVIVTNQRLRSTGMVYSKNSQREVNFRLWGRADDTIFVYDDRGELVKQFTIPPSLRGMDLFFDETSAGAVVAWRITSSMHAEKTEYEVFWFDAAGQVTRKETIALQGQGQPPDAIGVSVGVLLPAPAFVCTLVWLLWPLAMLAQGRFESWPHASAEALQICWPGLVLAVLLGGSLAYLCWRRESRYAASNRDRLFWALFVFAFGLPGWIGYRYGRSWPALVDCPTCNARVPCDRVACAACQTEFPVPALKGSEIFA